MRENPGGIIEKAVSAGTVGDVVSFTKDRGISRVYFGHEFCHHLLPDGDQLMEVMEICVKSRIPFTLTTSVLPPGGMERFQKLAEILDKKASGNQEILVGDWGALWYLHKKYPRRFQIVLGRLLARQRTGPRIELIKNKSPRQYESARRCHLNVEAFIMEMKAMGVVRFELDWPTAGIHRDFLKSIRCHVPLSVHTPWVYVSTTLRCPMTGPDGCRCGEAVHRLRSKSFPVDLYNRGNTLFYRSTGTREALDTGFFDRLVVDHQDISIIMDLD